MHDVIGTRCDPYTNLLLKGTEYHHCCHSNLTRALAKERHLPLDEAEVHVHDVMNVFMCTGYTRDTHQYFMKASPVRPGDFIEFFAEIDLLVALSACPGGDCGASHSDDAARCYPLKVEVHRPREEALAGSHHRPTDILARMEPGKRPLRLIRGSLEPSDGPLRTAAILCLPKSVRWSPASRPPAALLRLALLCHFRTFTANEVLRPKASVG